MPGHHGVPGLGQGCACLAGQLVVLVVLVEAGRAEDGHTGVFKVEAFEAAQELQEESHRAFEVRFTAAPALEEQLLCAFDLAEQ